MIYGLNLLFLSSLSHDIKSKVAISSFSYSLKNEYVTPMRTRIDCNFLFLSELKSVHKVNSMSKLEDLGRHKIIKMLCLKIFQGYGKMFRKIS